MFGIFKKAEKSLDYGDIKPKGFKTTYHREEMTNDEWNVHIKDLLERARKSNTLHSSEIRHENIHNFR